jgi:hypothetical protein
VSKRIKNNHIRLPDFPHMRSERQMRKKNLQLHSRNGIKLRGIKEAIIM